MARKFNTVKINKRGGLVPAGDLLFIARAAREAGADAIRFGNRQQLLLKIPVERTVAFCDQLKQQELFAELNADIQPNIVSSFAAENVFHQSAWLREGDYRDILDAFTFRPSLKVNLVDKDQCFVPFYTGHLNFITSSLPNYWHLGVRMPRSNDITHWPGLIYSYDIPAFCAVMEELMAAVPEKITYSMDVLVKGLNERRKFITQPVSEELQLPGFRLPYYEGFNQFGQQTWLGIYRRNELFSLSFIEDLSQLSAQCCITPWKSLIIKNIDPAQRRDWDYVLNRHRINVRHASNELNWVVEDGSEEGLILKRMLVSHFDREDLRTYGLCFAIKLKPGSGLRGSVVIRKLEGKITRVAMEKFDILYTKDFNPNTRELVLFRSAVKREDLGTYLASLCKYYYESLQDHGAVNHKVYREETQNIQVATHTPEPLLHQCRFCKTIYDPAFGDLSQGIEKGTAFDSLPDAYVCSTCESPKADFESIVLQPEFQK